MISKIESGDANPTLDVIEAIAKALGVQPYDLFSKHSLDARAERALRHIRDHRIRESAIIVLEKMADFD